MNHLITALHPRQVNCFFANFIIPLFEGVEIETDLVWLPWSNSLLAFFRIGSKILKSGCRLTSGQLHIFLESRGKKLWIPGEASDTNLADLVLKVVLRINGYIIVQNINWIFWFLICLHAERQMYQTYNHHMTDNTVAHDADFFFTFAPFAALIIT